MAWPPAEPPVCRPVGTGRQPPTNPPPSRDPTPCDSAIAISTPSSAPCSNCTRTVTWTNCGRPCTASSCRPIPGDYFQVVESEVDFASGQARFLGCWESHDLTTPDIIERFQRVLIDHPFTTHGILSGRPDLVGKLSDYYLAPRVPQHPALQRALPRAGRRRPAGNRHRLGKPAPGDEREPLPERAAISASGTGSCSRCCGRTSKAPGAARSTSRTRRAEKPPGGLVRAHAARARRGRVARRRARRTPRSPRSWGCSPRTAEKHVEAHSRQAGGGEPHGRGTRAAPSRRGREPAPPDPPRRRSAPPAVRDRQPAVLAERARRDLDAGRALAALVLGEVHQREPPCAPRPRRSPCFTISAIERSSSTYRRRMASSTS